MCGIWGGGVVWHSHVWSGELSSSTSPSVLQALGISHWLAIMIFKTSPSGTGCHETNL